jgi:hypothetical protein
MDGIDGGRKFAHLVWADADAAATGGSLCCVVCTLATRHLIDTLNTPGKTM